MVTYTSEYPMIATSPGGRGMLNFRPIMDGPIVGYRSESDLITEIGRRAPTSREVGEFRFTVRRRDGTIVNERTFLYQPKPLWTRDSLEVEAQRRLRNAPADLAAAARRYLYLPEYQPPVAQIAARPDDGSHWIVRDFAEEGRDPHTR